MIASIVSRPLIRWSPLIALIGVRLFWLDGASLWLDELGSWAAATTTSWGDLLRLLGDPQAGYPLYHLLLWGWLGLAGDSAWMLRLPSALAGVAAALTVAAAAVHLGRSSAACLLLFVIAPFPLWFAQEATAYSLVLWWGAIWVWGLLRFLGDDPRAGHILLVAAPLGLLLHRVAALAVISGIAAIICCPPPHLTRPVRMALAITMLSLLAGVALVISTGYLPTPALSATSVSVPQALLLTLWFFCLNHGPTIATLPLLAPLVLLALWGGLALLRAAPANRVARGLLIYTLAAVVLFIVQFTWTKRYEPRYLMTLYPSWALLALPPKRMRIPRRPVQALLALVIAAQLGSNLLPGGIWGPLPVREQYREALTALLHSLHPDDRLLIYPAYIDVAWRYYAPRIDPSTPHLPVVVVATLPPAWPGQRELVLVAPLHASIAAQHDPQAPSLGDPPGTTPCGGTLFQGVEIRCRVATAPRVLPPRPSVALFGDWLVLRSAELLTPPAGLMPGASLPIRLDWETLRVPKGADSFVLRLSRVGAAQPIREEAAPALGGALPSQRWAPSWRFTDRRAITLADATGHPLPPGSYRITLTVTEGSQVSPARGPDSSPGAAITLGIVSVGAGGFAPCLAGRPDGCGQIRVAKQQFFDRRGPWVAHGVQFFLPQYGINEQSFWDDHYTAARADGSLDFWLNLAALRLNPNLLRIFVALPSVVEGRLNTPTSYATIYDFAERAAARGMRLGVVLHNSSDWAMTPERQVWIEGLISYFLDRGTLERIAYLSADNELNNHCFPARQFDCFARDPGYREAATTWAYTLNQIVKARSPQLLVTVGMATELANSLDNGVANYWQPDRLGHTLTAAVDFLAPHNYAGRAAHVLATIRAGGYVGPVVLEEYGFPTDPVPQNGAYTEGPPTCRQDPLRHECLGTAPYLIELNLNALRTGNYAGGVAWMLADTLEKDLPDACTNPALTFDLWTGLLAAGDMYCAGGTRTRTLGAPKATGLRVCAYHTGSIDLCLADALFLPIPPREAESVPPNG